MNRDGTVATASRAEMKIAKELAKDPWGRSVVSMSKHCAMLQVFNPWAMPAALTPWGPARLKMAMLLTHMVLAFGSLGISVYCLQLSAVQQERTKTQLQPLAAWHRNI